MAKRCVRVVLGGVLGGAWLAALAGAALGHSERALTSPIEQPSRAQPTSSQGDNADGTYSYGWHRLYPNDANLVAIIGRKNVTLEGSGGGGEPCAYCGT